MIWILMAVDIRVKYRTFIGSCTMVHGGSSKFVRVYVIGQVNSI